MADIVYVNNITPEKKSKILENSVMAQPNNVTSNPNELKKAFVKPIVNEDGSPSIADEIDRVAEEANYGINRARGYAANNERRIIELETTAQTLEKTTASNTTRIISVEGVVQSQLCNAIEVVLDENTYVLTFKALAENGTVLSTSSVDFPIESVVVGGQFDEDTSEIVLTLKNGNEIRFPVSNIVGGFISDKEFDDFLATKGKANGFAGLDENGKVPKEQLPASSGGDGISAEEFDELLVESLTNPTEEWTDEDKAAACETIGAVKQATEVTARPQLYMKNPDGTNKTVDATTDFGSSTVPLYNPQGKLTCSAPTFKYHTTNKEYVDGSIDELRAEITDADLSEIYDILDLAGVTETIETTSTYDVRDTAEVGDAALKVLPGTGTKVTKVEGNGATSENMLNIAAIDRGLWSSIDIENGEITIKAISNAPNPVPIILGKFSDLIPTAKVGDTLYINAEDNAGAISGGTLSVGASWTVNGTSPLTVVAGMLDQNVTMGFANTGTGKRISKFIVSKEYNPTFIPYYNGIKNSTFNGIVSSNKNLWDNNVNSWTKGTNTATSTGNVQHFSNWINIPVGVERLATSINGVGAIMQIESVKVGNNEYESGTSTGEAVLNLANTGRYGITAVKVSTYLPPDTNLAEITTQIEIGDTVTEYVPHVSSALNFPATEMPLGRVLDFENKKVKDYGANIILDGTENWTFYTYGDNHGARISSYFQTKYNYGNCVCTDAPVATATTRDKNSIGLGQNNEILYWYSILDSLGFTTKGTAPTTDEQKEAIASFKAWLAKRYVDENPVIIRYIANELQSERDMTEEEIAAGNTYMPIAGGIEYQKGNSSAVYGANNTVTQEYDMYRKLGGDN